VVVGFTGCAEMRHEQDGNQMRSSLGFVEQAWAACESENSGFESLAGALCYKADESADESKK
jgi:hypothetical protein